MSEFVTKVQHDAEMAALKAEVDALKAQLSVMQQHIGQRLQKVESDVAPMRVIGGPRSLSYPKTDTGPYAR